MMIKEGDQVQRKTGGPAGIVTHVTKTGVALVVFSNRKSPVRVPLCDLVPGFAERRPPERPSWIPRPYLGD